MVGFTMTGERWRCIICGRYISNSFLQGDICQKCIPIAEREAAEQK